MSVLPANGDDDFDDATEAVTIFVEQYLKTGNAMIACSRAGIRDPRYPMEVTAERTLQRPDIQFLIKAFGKLQVPEQPIEVTRETNIVDMQTVYEKALEDRQYGSAISAKKLQSLLMGVLTQNINVTHRHTVDNMSDDELMRIANQSDRKIIDVTPEDDDDGFDPQ